MCLVWIIEKIKTIYACLDVKITLDKVLSGRWSSNENEVNS